MKHFLPILLCCIGILLGYAFSTHQSQSAPLSAPYTLQAAAANPQISSVQNHPKEVKAERDELTPAVLSEISALRKEMELIKRGQEQHQRQLAETNRDLAELQFQVDSHSESFRPLRREKDSSDDDSIPDIPDFIPGQSLLPPQ